jgi:hypothetical protein
MPPQPESFALVPGKAGKHSLVLACGSDPRGLTYAILELADRVNYSSDALRSLKLNHSVVEKPANRVRSNMRLFASDVEDKAWFYDRAFWSRYLTMLATERFNRFSLALGLGYDFPVDIHDAYFHFAYPFLVAVPGYDVRVTSFTEAEREQNLHMLRFISDETAARGLQFQLGLWTHAYRWTNSPHANHVIEGLNPDNHAAYCRDALAALLKACPAISGVTFRVHGESGVAEGSYAFWKTVFQGLTQCGRTVGLDMHAKGMDSEMIEVALSTGLPVSISPKFWAEHMGLPYHQAGIRPTEMPPQGRKDEGFFSKSSGSRSFLRYGYGDLLVEGRRYDVLHRIWPGTQRLLLWGDPVFASAYSRAASFCGSSGMELFEPLSFKGRKGSGLPGGRDGYADASLKSVDGDFEKYALGYRLWGRLLYHPEADLEPWRRLLTAGCGYGAKAAQQSLSNASRILPLITTAHTPSAANNNYWPEIYTNMPIVDAGRKHPYGDTPSPKRFGTVSPLDPQLFTTVEQYADALLAGKSDGRYSPLEVSDWLLAMANAATRFIKDANKETKAGSTPTFRRLAADVAIQANIGRFFASKFRASVAYALYQRTGEKRLLEIGISAYTEARQAWAQIASETKGVYVSDITFGLEPQLRGHWQDRLLAIDEDIRDMEKQRLGSLQAVTDQVSKETLDRILRVLTSLVPRPAVRVQHVPALSFHKGSPLEIEMAISHANPISVSLVYRHTNQAEQFVTSEMSHQKEGAFRVVIPASYTDSPFPLQYYFQLRNDLGNTWLYPGLGPSLSQQPYYVVRQG